MKKCETCECLIADGQRFCYRCSEKQQNQFTSDRKSRKDLKRKIKRERADNSVERCR